MANHEIVIVGANQAGVPMAHYLLKFTIPQLESLSPSSKFHVTMISPNTDYYWKIAGPRALVSYEAMPKDDILKPIAKGFEKYSQDKWSHVLGKATNVDGASKTVTVQLSNGGEQAIVYNSLIIATGTHYESALWTSEYGTKATVDAHQATQKALKEASSIIIAGGGPVGVETAGEISDFFPKAKVSLISGGKTVLEKLPKNIGVAAERLLKAGKVDVINGKRVQKTEEVNKQTVVTFDDGSSLTADLYINAFAGKPNTGFLPATWLEKGHVITNKETLRATASGADNVYSLGDAHTNSNKQSMAVADAIGVVGSALALDFVAGLSQDEKAKVVTQSQNNGLFGWLLSLFSSGGNAAKAPVQKPYKTIDNVQIVPIGKGGTGILFGWKAPGWFVHMMKGKNYMTNYVGPTVDGSAFAKP